MKLPKKIQRLILENIDDEFFNDKAVCRELNYSSRHLNRIFSQFTGKTVSEYIKALRLSQSTLSIESGKGILDAAIQAGYETNEGYSKAFGKMFGKTPSEYKKSGGMIARFVPYPVGHSYEFYHRKGVNQMKNSIVCTAYIADKPKRKLIILRSEHASDYLSFCQECGCDWEGYLNSNPQKADTAAIIRLPKQYVKAGTSDIAAGIEVPLSYEENGLADGYEIIEAEPCRLIYFKSQPFTNPDDFCLYIDAVNEAYNSFDFSAMGVAVDMSAGPYMNFGAEPERGAKIAYPVKPTDT